MRALLLMLGLPDMPLFQLVIFLALVAVAMLLMGWISDMALGNGGYGVIMNGVVMLAGAIGGALLWRKLGYKVPINAQLASALVATASGMALLLFCAVTRRFL